MARSRDKSAEAEGLSLEGDAGIGEVQERFDEAAEKGFFGNRVDPTPNENYSLEGGIEDVRTGKTGPTPETDRELAQAARNAALGDPFENYDASQDPQEVRKARESSSSSADESKGSEA